MNPYERANLERLAKQYEEAETIKEILQSAVKQNLRSAAEEATKLYVAGLFEIAKGDTDKVKRKLREDRELFTGLDLTTIINDCYTKYTKATARYNEELHNKFELWFSRLRRTGESGLG